jgi:O-methyltransferase domain
MPQKQTCDWMRQQLTGFMRTQIIAAAATLSLAEHFHTGPRTVEEIARLTGLDREITFRFLRALAAIGLVASADERTFAALPPLETLLAAVPGSLRDLAMFFATPGQYVPWVYFLQGLTMGEPQATTALGSNLFDYYVHHPEEVAIFHKTMHVSTAGVTAEIGQRLDTSASRMAVDVGGASGSLLYSLMQRNPQLHGIVYDRPENVARAQAAAVVLGLSERSTAVAGDFFDAIPEGDLYLLRFILHDWNDADCIRILHNCRRAMRPGSRVVLVEAFLGRVGQDVSPDIADMQGALIDLHMLVVAGERERSVSQYADLLQHAELSLTATTPLPSGYVLMEATTTGER